MADEERTNHRDDAEYWGLTLHEQISYFGRLSRYNRAAAARHFAAAERYGRQARRFRLATYVVVGIVLLIQLVAWMASR